MTIIRLDWLQMNNGGVLWLHHHDCDTTRSSICDEIYFGNYGAYGTLPPLSRKDTLNHSVCLAMSTVMSSLSRWRHCQNCKGLFATLLTAVPNFAISSIAHGKLQEHVLDGISGGERLW